MLVPIHYLRTQATIVEEESWKCQMEKVCSFVLGLSKHRTFIKILGSTLRAFSMHKGGSAVVSMQTRVKDLNPCKDADIGIVTVVVEILTLTYLTN